MNNYYLMGSFSDQTIYLKDPILTDLSAIYLKRFYNARSFRIQPC